MTPLLAAALLLAPQFEAELAASERQMEAAELRSYGLPADAFDRAEADSQVRASHARYVQAGGAATLPQFARAYVRSWGFARAPAYDERARPMPAMRAVEPSRLLVGLVCEGGVQVTPDRPAYAEAGDTSPAVETRPWRAAVMIDIPAGAALGDGVVPERVAWGTHEEIVFMPPRGDLEHSVWGQVRYDRRTRELTGGETRSNVISRRASSWSARASCRETPVENWGATWRAAITARNAAYADAVRRQQETFDRADAPRPRPPRRR